MDYRVDNQLEEWRKLIVESIPPEVEWEFKGTHTGFDLTMASKELPSIDEVGISGELPREWYGFRPFGEELFDNGSALFCINEIDGSVLRLDVEMDDPVHQVNKSVKQFVASFLALNSHFANEETGNSLDEILSEIDHDAYQSGSYWKTLVNYLNGS